MTPNTTQNEAPSLYIYQPSHILPAVFAALVGISWALHIFQNIRYKFWRITFWICWAGVLFTTGWIVRCIFSYHPANVNLYIVQTVLIYVGPPIYSASAYNIIGRLMNYLPMHAVLNPNRVLITFVYIGAAVESVTVAGAAKNASAGSSLSEYKSGGTLIAIGQILQGAVETVIIAIVATVHRRCARAGKVPRNVRKLCITLYGTSTLVLLRCIFRAVETFEMFSHIGCRENCGPILSHEWFLYAFELGPMLVFTWWLNVLHPGQSLPNEKNRYLDLDGCTERLGPGWIDQRSTWATFVDPFDFGGIMKGEPAHDMYWLRPNEWPVCDGSFALGTASNARNRAEEKSEDISLASEV
ncbi:hypothetical protein N7474_008657 [Penicillium riverlandense]|uniref:uncharacterized protein n=1 Tax=Penicillium riverlandense TaxID=1903569 RepID=UPI002547CB96|nr:uncharacterized protein N7474_008657 [Penicillium riverlandense]KAJ5812356.1 hypothetical protein N7474_008657 [Penicillium riverlandense]